MKFHPSRDAKEIPRGKQTTSPPSEPSEPIKKENNKRKRSFPDDFQVSDELRTWARDKGLRSPDEELAAFRDYHLSKGTLFQDWMAAFRTWLRNNMKFNGNKNTKRSTYNSVKAEAGKYAKFGS